MNLKALLSQAERWEFVGSRVTCDPPPVGTDIDILCFGDEDFEDAAVECNFEPSPAYGDNIRFISYRNGDYNLIVTSDEEFYDKFMVATVICARLNLQKKEDRIMVFRGVLYGEGPKTMTILSSIRMLEGLAPAAAKVDQLVRLNDELAKKVDRLDVEARSVRDKIVLDPDKDPDPYGNFGISLVDRLHAMGWPV